MTPEAGSVVEVVKLFPLPGMVLFPRTRVGLHIFEPRYRVMTDDALFDGGFICIALIAETVVAERLVDPSFVPTVAPVAGIGRILESERLADGRYNLVLEGVARARIHELPFNAPYRRASAEILGESGAARPDEVMALLASITRFANYVKRRATRLELDLPSGDDAGHLCDVCAHQLVIAGEDRQRLLETADVGARVRLCTEILAIQEGQFGSHPGLN
jgi:Lon protease-like protein